MGNSPSQLDPDREYSAPSKEFKQKMEQMGVIMSDLHKEYILPRKFKDHSDLNNRFRDKKDKHRDDDISYEEFYKWLDKQAKKIIPLNPSLNGLYETAIENDKNYVNSQETLPELAHLIYGIASQFNENDINHYLDCNRTRRDNSEFGRRVDSKVSGISDDPHDLPQWVISEPTARIINQAIDRRVQRALNPENFRNEARTSGQMMR